jgi:hypothetical protein
VWITGLSDALERLAGIAADKPAVVEALEGFWNEGKAVGIDCQRLGCAGSLNRLSPISSRSQQPTEGSAARRSNTSLVTAASRRIAAQIAHPSLVEVSI